MLLLEVAFPFLGVGRQRIEHQLQIRSGRDERHLGVSFATAILEANLALLERPFTIAGESNLIYGRKIMIKQVSLFDWMYLKLYKYTCRMYSINMNQFEYLNIETISN